MKLRKGSILIETLIALIVMMIMSQTILSLANLELIESKIISNYEQGI